jgi:spermidine synthase
MNSMSQILAAVSLAILSAVGSAQAQVLVERTSAYHHIKVIDEQGLRTLSFNSSMETRMSLRDPLQGHFEYTEYFHTPWLWNTNMTNVLMLGLGGGSTQRSYQHYYPQVTVDTAEIDPVVVEIAKEYFQLRETPTLRVFVSDGRVFLRRSETKYGAILMDAYTQGRYGSSIPYHLATKEFFAMATNHLAPDGVFAFNVIGTMRGWRADIVGSIWRTMKSVFPQVYAFPARDTYNVVIVGTKSDQPMDLNTLLQRANVLTQTKRVTLPTFKARVNMFVSDPPLNYQRCPLLTDDFAPIDGLLSTQR